MNFDKFTEKTRTFFQEAQTLAARMGHQSLDPEHLLKVMLDDSDGITVKLIKAANGDPARLKGDVELALSKIPVVSGSGAGQLRLSSDLLKRLCEFTLINK